MKWVLIFFLGFSSLIWSQFQFNYSNFIGVLHDGQLMEKPWDGGLNTPQFSSIDYDFDGDEDLLIFDRSANQIRVYKNIQVGATNKYELDCGALQFFPPNLTNRITTFDYDQDGRKDLFCYAVGGIKAFRNIGSATQGLQWHEYSPYLVSNYEGPTLNLYISGADIPALVDVEGDGDMDILTYHISGEYLQYHQNQSQELYGHSDSLVFILKNRCWGKYREDVTSNTLFLNDTSSYCNDGNVSNPELRPNDQAKAHAGSTVLALDIDQSGVLDLILGDVAYGNLVKLINGGVSPNTNSPMINADYNFPSNTIPANVQLFPAAYYIDVDFDSKKDLIVAPNANNVSENENSVWFYKNLSTNEAPIFVFQENDWLQSQMIDHGLGSVPFIFDVNSDGLQDLLVANFFAYKPLLDKESRIAYYQNIGTLTNPQFVLIDQDFLNLSSANHGLRLLPAMGDLNDDGKPDLLLGNDLGQIIYYQNNSTGATPSFALQTEALLDNNNQIIQVPLFSSPQLIDLNDDQLLDLVIGHKGGKILYYQNTGTMSNPQFTLVSNVLGGVNVQSNGPDGFSVPHFFKHLDTLYLLVGSLDGSIHFYDSIQIGNNQNFHERSADFLSLGNSLGAYSAPYIANLDNDSHLELFIGQDLGGLTLLEDDPSSDLSTMNYSLAPLIIYPNPATDHFYVKGILNSQTATLYNLTGQVIESAINLSQGASIDISGLSSGTYLLVLDNGQTALLLKK